MEYYSIMIKLCVWKVYLMMWESGKDVMWRQDRNKNVCMQLCMCACKHVCWISQVSLACGYKEIISKSRFITLTYNGFITLQSSHKANTNLCSASNPRRPFPPFPVLLVKALSADPSLDYFIRTLWHLHYLDLREAILLERTCSSF